MIEQDNQSAMKIVANGSGMGGKSKYYSIRFFWVKELVEAARVMLSYVNTTLVKADGLTKPLIGQAFHQFKAFILYGVVWESKGQDSRDLES